MTTDEELATWRTEWQSLGGSEGFGRALVERASRDARQMKWSAAKEILGAAFSTVTCGYLVHRLHGSPEVIAVTALILLFNGAWITHFFAVRAGTFEANAKGLDAFVELTRARMKGSLRWNTFGARSTLVLSAALVPWSVWMFLAHEAAYLAAPWRAFVGFGGWMAIMAGLLVFLRWKRTKLVAELDRFERQVAEVALA